MYEYLREMRRLDNYKAKILFPFSSEIEFNENYMRHNEPAVELSMRGCGEVVGEEIDEKNLRQSTSLEMAQTYDKTGINIMSGAKFTV